MLAYYRQVVNQLDFKKSGGAAADFSSEDSQISEAENVQDQDNSSNDDQWDETPRATSEEVDTDNKATDVQVFYFHATRRCETCQAVENVSKEAIKEYRFKKNLSRIESLGMFPTSTLIAINTFQTESIEDYEKCSNIVKKL